jgi:hypothetical protein
MGYIIQIISITVDNGKNIVNGKGKAVNGI